jgi:serine/threonine protein kinase
LFIKTKGFVGSKKIEYHCLLKCFQQNHTNFVEPLFYYDGFNSRDFRCVASTYLEGESLETLLAENQLSVPEKKNILLQIKDIAQTLCDVRVAHRDLHMGNLWVTPQGHVKCIDFGWAVEIDNYEECRAIRRYPLLYRRLKRLQVPGYFLRSDDVHSLLNILPAIGIDKEYEETYRLVETYLQDRVGRNAVEFKHKYSFIFYRCLRAFLRVSLVVLKNIMPPGTLRATLQRGLEKKVYYID